MLALLSTDRSEYQWRIARIPPARAFVGDSGHSELPNRCHLLGVKRSREGLGRAEGRILFGGITQPQERYVWIAGERVVQALLHRQMRQERPLPCGMGQPLATPAAVGCSRTYRPAAYRPQTS